MYNRRLISGLAVASGAAASSYVWLDQQRTVHASSKFEPPILSTQQVRPAHSRPRDTRFRFMGFARNLSWPQPRPSHSCHHSRSPSPPR